MKTTEDHRPNRIIHFWRVAGGGSLTLSIAVHAVFVVVAWMIVSPQLNREPTVDFLPSGKSAGSMKASQVLEDQKNLRRTRQRDQLMKSARLAVPGGGKVTIPQTDASFDLDEIGVDGDLFKRANGAPGDKVFIGSHADGQPPHGGPNYPSGFDGFLPHLLKSRCSSAERLNKLKANGGTPQCERAVSTALEWLKTQQNKDGSWGKTHREAMTGLTLLCYFGRCETPDSPFYGDSILNGLMHLIEVSRQNPYGIISSNPSAHSASYEHGIATYALGEMYSLARMGNRPLPGMREAFEKGVRVIIDHQLPDGGWGYGEAFCYRDSGAGDLSVTGWQFQALKTAKLSGLKIEGLHTAIARTVKYLASKQTKDGGFGGANREAGYNQWNLTGAGLLGLQTLGGGQHRNDIKKGIGFATLHFDKEPPEWQRNANLYAWYYYTQAFFQNGGQAWTQWNDAVLPQLLASQSRSGAWTEETTDSSIASSASAGTDRELYRTALCTLMLEVYFRYLRVADRDEAFIFTR